MAFQPCIPLFQYYLQGKIRNPARGAIALQHILSLCGWKNKPDQGAPVQVVLCIY